MTTKVISKLAPKNSGAFPTHSDIHTEGGFQVRADTTDRDSIPTLNRKQGMWVKLLSDGKVYTLGSGLTNSDWTEVVFGGTSATSFDGGTPENIKAPRTSFPSAINNSYSGIVNLGSDTTGASIGVINNYGTVSGGDQNAVSGEYGTIGGGNQNSANTTYATVGGGYLNHVNGDYATISGGNNNGTGAATSAFIGGGEANNINNGWAVVAGGQSNGVGNGGTGTWGAVGGGNSNNVTGDYGVISGGQGNTVTGEHGTISGGLNNTAGSFGTVCGGQYNNSGGNATICGGTGNTANGPYSTILNGGDNTTDGNAMYSVAMGAGAGTDKRGQFAHSCGGIYGIGYTQFTRLVYMVEDVNAAGTNFDEFIQNVGYTLLNSRSYAMNITVAAAKSAAVTQDPAMYFLQLLVSVDNAGAVTILQLGTTTSVGPGVALYSGVTFSSSTNLFILTFTGQTGETVRAVATIEATELGYV